MKAWADELGWPVGFAIIVLALALSSRLDNKARDCAVTCGARGVARFHVEAHPGCQSDTPVCECNK